MPKFKLQQKNHDPRGTKCLLMDRFDYFLECDCQASKNTVFVEI